MRTLLALLFCAAIAPAQNITWRFTDDINTPGCPSSTSGYPMMEDPLGIVFNPQISVSGTISITWFHFDARQPVMLCLSTDQSRSFAPPCTLVPPDVTMFGTVTGWGECRFTWNVPITAPLSAVPLGTWTMGAGQVLQIDVLLPQVTSYVFDIVSNR